jgi:hypothetical protein
MMVPDLHLIPGLWKIDGYSKLLRYVQQEFTVTPGKNLFTFPYDWRRDNRIAAHRLKERTDRWLWQWQHESPDARLILVGHSMGGLVARYFLECLDGWRVTRRLVTFGTPYRGSLNALSFLVHGMQKRLGPVPVLELSRLLRSFPSVYQLLPIYPCVDTGDGTLIRISEAAGLPHVDPGLAQAADAFHREIEQAVAAHLDDDEYRRGRYTIHPVVGTFQSTKLSALLSGDSVQLLGTYPGFGPDGDGTVPRVSATPMEFPHEEGAMFAAERHGSLQHNDGVLVQLAGLLSGQNTSAVRAGTDAGLALDDAFGPGEPVTFRFRAADPMAPLTAMVTAVQSGAEVARLELGTAGDWRDGALAPPPPGAYRLLLAGDGVEPVSDVFVVIGEQDPTETGEVRTRGGPTARSAHAKDRYEGMVKRLYQKPTLTRLGLLRELTKFSHQNGRRKRLRFRETRGALHTPRQDRPEKLIISSATAGDGGLPVPERRLLQGRFPEQVRLGEEVTLLVRLGLQPGARLETELAPLAVPEAALEVVLLLVDSAGFTLRSPERQAVRVVPRQDSSWAAFELQSTREGVHTLQVEAFAGGTGLGGLAVQVSVDPGTPTSPLLERSIPAALTPPDEGAISLLLSYDADRQVYRYRLVDSGGYYSEEAATNRLLQPPGEVVEQLVAQLNALARGQAGWDAVTTRDWLQGQGIALWNSFIPQALQREFWQRRDRITQITIVSDGDPVPWELLYPFAPGGQDAGFLVDQFPVARRRYGPRLPRQLELRAADLVLSGDGLAAAPAEITALDGLLQSQGMTARHIGDLPGLLQAFQRGDLGVLHFICHNAFARGAPNASRILLAGQPFEPVFLEQHVGRFASPLVFMNACRTDGQAPLYTTVEGWAAPFLRAGAGAFVGSLWEVVDTSAAIYAQQFYQAALAGTPLGEAARQARDAIRENPADPTWLAYTLYADPAATVIAPPVPRTRT